MQESQHQQNHSHQHIYRNDLCLHKTSLLREEPRRAQPENKPGPGQLHSIKLALNGPGIPIGLVANSLEADGISFQFGIAIGPSLGIEITDKIQFALTGQ